MIAAIIRRRPACRRLCRLCGVDAGARLAAPRARAGAAEAAAAARGSRPRWRDSRSTSSSCACDGCDKAKAPVDAPKRSTPLRRRRRRADRLSSAPAKVARGAERSVASSGRRASPGRRGPSAAGKWTRSGVPAMLAHRHRAERAQPIDDRLDQHLGRRGAGRDADARACLRTTPASGRPRVSTM